MRTRMGSIAGLVIAEEEAAGRPSVPPWALPVDPTAIRTEDRGCQRIFGARRCHRSRSQMSFRPPCSAVEHPEAFRRILAHLGPPTTPPQPLPGPPPSWIASLRPLWAYQRTRLAALPELDAEPGSRTWSA